MNEHKQEQAKIYANMRYKGKEERERILVEMSINESVPKWAYIAAQTAHEAALIEEKERMLVRLIEGHAPHLLALPRPETPEERFARQLKRRNRILLSIVAAVASPGIFIIAADFSPRRLLITAAILIPIAILTYPRRPQWPKRDEIF